MTHDIRNCTDWELIKRGELSGSPLSNELSARLDETKRERDYLEMQLKLARRCNGKQHTE